MPGLFDFLGGFAQQAAPAVGAYARGQVDHKARQAQAQQEADERQRQIRMEALQRALLNQRLERGSFDLEQARNPTPEQPDVTVTRDTEKGRFSVSGAPGTVNPVLDTLPPALPPEQPTRPVVGLGTRDWDEYTRRLREQAQIRDGGSGPGGIEPAPGEARTRILAGLPRMEQGLAQIEQFLARPGPDGVAGTEDDELGTVPVQRFLGSRTLGRYLQGEDLQAYQSAAERLVGSILRVESGAAIRPEEVQELARQMVPQPEDKPEVVRQKMEVLRSTVSRMKELGGVSTGTSAPPSAGAPRGQSGPTSPGVAPGDDSSGAALQDSRQEARSDLGATGEAATSPQQRVQQLKAEGKSLPEILAIGREEGWIQ